MAILINAHQLKKSFGARPLFEGITFSLESGERVGLIGPNGAGKSTLLRILAGKMDPDEGTLSSQRGLSIGYLEQTPEFSPGATVHSAVLEGSRDPDDWEEISRTHEILSKLSLSGGSEAGGTGISLETPVSELSGGWKKRVALARELVRQPDLLLLDEPTNHLDVESILWLEDLLSHAPFATLTITHDRVFLQKVSNRILELDRRNPKGLLSVKGDYATYLETKESMMAAQSSQETRLRNTLRRETEWLRQGAKARTTKQQARIQRAGELKDTVEELGYRNQNQKVRMDAQSTEKSPKKLIEAKGISKSYGGRQIIRPMDLLITAKSRIGLLGANGCGKSTLIRMLLGTEPSDTGTIVRSDLLKISYFEQNRDSLDPSLSVLKTICPSGDHVDYRGTRVHVKGYLDRFLFTNHQLEMAVGKLSGGEQSRLLIARLLLREANLLVLDEPTNDLDMATLNVMEEMLQEFTGAVLLVTHDRYFLDQVATHILAFGSERMETFTGLSQWETWHAQEALRFASVSRSAGSDRSSSSKGKKRKLSFNEQRELDGMEANIHRNEEKLKTLSEESEDPALTTNAKRLTELSKAMAELQDEISRLYARWAELEKP